MKKIINFSIFVSFLSAQLFTFDLKYFQLSLFRICIIALALICFFVNYKIFIPTGKNRFYVTFIIIWFFYGLISFYWTKDIYNWVRTICFLGSGALCVICYNAYLKSEKDFSKSINIFQFGILLNILIGWFEIITKKYYFISIENQLFYSSFKYRIPIALMGNPNNFALLTFFGIFISFACYKINKNKFLKFISLFILINSFILLFMTRSRGNIIGLFISILFLLLVHRKGKLIILLSTIILLTTPFIQNYINEVITFNFDIQNTSDNIRINLIKNGLYFIIVSFGFGIGAGGSKYWLLHYAKYNTNGILLMHNWWAEILSEFGIIIFIIYLIFYFNLFKYNFRYYKRNNTTIRYISLCICCLLVGFIISSISASSNMSSEWLWVFWSIIISYQKIIRENK